MLELFRTLTERVDTWGVWKNADASLRGEGDVDSSGSEAAAPAVFDAFAGWAAARGHTVAARCGHSPGLSIMVAAAETHRELVQLDLWHRAYFRGAEILDWRRVLPLMELDQRGFRRLRRGAEGVVLMLFNGMLRGGRPDREALARKDVGELLTADPDGAAEAVAALSLPRSVAAVARAVKDGGWDRGAAVSAEAAILARALRDPSALIRRVAFRAAKVRCPVVAALEERRRTPSPFDEWVEEVARSHEVVAL